MAPDADATTTLLPLAEAQEGLWFAQRRAPHDPLFNTGQSVELHGPLDRAAFAAAVAQALAEADALALRIVETGHGPRQVVDPARRPGLARVDLAAEADPRAAAQARIAAEMARPTDPAREALAATTLYRLGERHHLWHLRIHHLAIDGYGIILLTRRVAELYNAAVAGEPAGAPLTPFAVALAEDAACRAGPKREADAAFWRDLFADRPEAASLAVTAPEAPPPGAPLFHRASVELGPAARAALEKRAAEAGLPWPDVATALAAAFCRRHTGTAEIILGVPHMGRLGSPAARAACMLMNVLPLRVTPDETAPLADFLTATGCALLRARRHGRYRSEQLRRDLRLVGGHQRLHGPLVNILPFDETPRFAGLDARLEVLSTGPVEDIGFTFRRHGGDGALRLEVDAAPALYGAAEAAALARRLEAFLAASADAGRLADIPTATPEETHHLVHRLNATDHPVPDTTLDALITERMRVAPDATALVFGASSMDYATLDARSAALAGQLAAAGIGPGDLVAVALPRSLELLVALVAVLRAGAAYLPLDLAQPEARLARILASARPKLALAEGEASPGLEPQVPVLPPQVPVLPPQAWAPAAPSGACPTPPRPDDAAYVIYTSGSTGEPKGVVVEHRAIVNRLLWMQAHYGFGPADVILQKTPATFDVSVWEFFLPLISGARLVIAPPEAHRDPLAIAALVRRHGVGTLHFVPSMLAAFLAEPAARGLALRRVFCSGEELPAALRERFHRTLTGELHNLYGPTEAAVDVSFWPAGPDDRSVPVPIGHPVWNTRLLVLDEHDRPAPPGVAGHLHLGGVQLARGYLGRPDLTAERFRPDPFRPGARLYATGDLARVRAEDGAVVFLGRSDHQVKIRGVRIELGEVEAALMATGRLREAVALARPDANGTARLVAYVVPAPAEPSGADGAENPAGGDIVAGLRAALARRLPEAMMPSAIVPMPALPVTANGKLDRAALPAPPQQALVSRPLAGATETRIAALFAEQLRLGARPGPEDDFFALGGDSLDAVGLLLKLREGFGRDPGLGALFAHPTVAGLARLMEQEGLSDAGLDPLIRLVEGDPTLPPLFAIHPAGGLAWCYGGLARALTPRRTVYGLQAPALDPAVPVAESLEALAADYAGRILATGPARPVHLAGWSVGGILAQAVAARLAAQGVAVGAVALLDSYPCDVWRAEPDPGEDGALKALLAIAGHDPDRLPTLALNRPAVLAFLRATDSPLARLPAAALDGVVRVVAGTNRLVRGHHHRRHEGTLTHFRAALDHRERALDPQMWRPYAAGLDVHDIPALHAHLTGPAAVAAIAPLLSATLAAREGAAEKPPARKPATSEAAARASEQDLTSCA